MDILGTRLGLLCLTIAVVMSGCAGSGASEPDLRTPPARDVPTGGAGDLADSGAGGITSP
ncbi:hypothetical protein KVF89_03535 [Nocardioides carbamazepini]|uniref:hypothetical protein n=1 Tax=Nocardioides carbamazepini TaxID=2854259 RepID=UPI00214A2785|nr:hypothetical protein [Nocardioides carbamazepini]MCR1781595.1 hypothetical protein [Nocardioides carbamazepini]